MLPVLFRIGFIALAFAGGAGIVLYGVAWIVMPPSHGGLSPGEEAFRRAGTGTRRLLAWIAVVLLVIGAGLFVNELGVHRPDLIWGGILELIVAFACIGTAVVLYPGVKRQNQAVALGFVAARVLEAATIVAGNQRVLHGAILSLARGDRAGGWSIMDMITWAALKGA